MKQTLKPELKSPEMKEAYVAAHWGQHVIKDVNGSGVLCTYPIVASNMYRIEESHLELTPLDQISDEHLIQLGLMLDWFALDFEDKPVIDHLDQLKGHLLNQAIDCDYYGINTSSDVVDFIRANGYAWRWNGHEVEELIVAGYCQLKPIEQNTASKSIENSIELGELKGGV